MNGQVKPQSVVPSGMDERLLLTQKRAAELLSVSRATIWRMTKDSLLHPVEIIPGAWRYPFREDL
jgi:predicted DNA-binding transcriptional regulator AlpA